LLPETQGKGFGKFMINEVIKIAKSNNQKGIYLNVNKYNTAKFFYEKLGFVISKEEVIDIGNDYVMDDYVMEYLF
jgi:ribosomal protein S18 acetylase RimI-like enzyme